MCPGNSKLALIATSLVTFSPPLFSRFHDPEEEIELSHDVVPYLDDNVQLSIEEYRGKLYEVNGN